MEKEKPLSPLYCMAVVTRTMVSLVVDEMKRQGVERVEDLKLEERSQEEIELRRAEIRALIDEDPIKLVVPQCISAPGYESGLAASIKEEQKNCPYCHEGHKQVCGFEKCGDEFYIARIMPDGNMQREKANFCHICGRKLET